MTSVAFWDSTRHKNGHAQGMATKPDGLDLRLDTSYV
jgi:hypothetical protein